MTGGPSNAHEDGPLRRLEDDVVARVALLQLAADFAFQVVALVYGLPEAMSEAEGIHHGAVHLDESGRLPL